MRAIVWVIALCCGMGMGSTAFAQTPDGTSTTADIVPDPLKPWVGWVLFDSPEVACPYAGGDRQCEWPGDLSVDVVDDGARFTMRVYLDRKMRVTLPGSAELWPQAVQTESGPATIVSDAGESPQAVLSAGTHTIRGEFEWSETPEVIDIPTLVGRVRMKIGGKTIDFPRVRDGKLFLGDAASEEGEADSLRVNVYRQLQDGVPMRVTTRLELSVSGKAREVDLGPIQLKNSVPISVNSELPTRAPKDGAVQVYVRPGTHFVDILSVVPESLTEIVVPKVESDFYEPQEVWVWRPDETVRAVQLSGLVGVDPERTTLPEEWRGDTTYLAEPLQKLAIAETRRGMPERPPNLVNLHRELWLDLDEQGYTVRDRISGQMNQGWRLNYAAGTSLGRASQGGTDLFITDDPETKMSGVEIRARNLDIEAELRMEDAIDDLAIVGWDHDVQSLQATIHLPPGWTLLGGEGVDRMPGTWIESWTLWDFFFVLMVALAIGKLFGWGWVPVSVIALCLAHGHGEAPRWIWIQLIASLALLRVVPQGFWRKAILSYRVVVLVALAVILAPYARQQIREALHPQVGDSNITFQETSSYRNDLVMQNQEMAGMAAPAEEPEMIEGGEYDELEEEPMIEKSLSIASRSPMPKKAKMKKGGKSDMDWSYGRLQQIDPNSVVQTGPGLPTWSWTRWNLNWSGPVRKDQRVSLWLIPPNINMILTFLRVALLILLALLLLAPSEMYWSTRRKSVGWWGKIFGQAAVFSLAVGFAFQARAEEPVFVQQASNQMAAEVDSDVLDTLKQRLIQDSQCEVCVVASRADIRVRNRSWSMTAEVHVEKLSSWGLPGAPESVAFDSILIDGQPTQQIRRGPQGLVLVRLTPGRHVVTVQGKLPNRNVITIQLDPDNPPKLVTFDSEDWSVDGVSPKGVPDASLQLTRKAEEGAASDQELVSELPPWFFVERTLQLGLPWQIRTVVRREDVGRPQLLKFPLLEGEKVISAETRVESNQALVDFDRGVGQVEFLSEIPINESIALSAAVGQPWNESWSVSCSRIWRCSFEGIPAIRDVTAGELQPHWQPWPGETLNISVQRPEGTPGQASTVEKVSYSMTPGKRLMQAQLDMTVRASQGTRQDVKLPANAELQMVTIDGVEKSIRPADGVVSLPVEPRTQQFQLTWQQPWDRQTVEQLPQIDIGASAVNTELKINLGEDRWLVWTSGPKWGPAILFWSHLVVLLILGLILGRIRNVPIRTWEWLLLMLGMSQMPIVASLPVVVWFVVLSWRLRKPPKRWEVFDLLQLFVVFLTMIAVGALVGAIHTNLLIDIDMQVEGANSTNSMLRWYVDQTSGPLPQASIISLPIWVWRLTMLVWAFWLVWRLLGWAKWGWTSFSDGGFWKKPPPRPPKKPVAPAQPTPEEKPAPEPTAVKVVEEIPAPPEVEVEEDVTVELRPSKTQLPKLKPVTKKRPKADGEVEADESKQVPRRAAQQTEPGTPRPEREATQIGVPQVDRNLAEQSESTPLLFPPPEEEEHSEASDEDEDKD